MDLDTWTPEQIIVRLALHARLTLLTLYVQIMDRWGNRKANLYWEAHLKEGHQPPEQCVQEDSILYGSTRLTLPPSQQNRGFHPIEIRIKTLGNAGSAARSRYIGLCSARQQ